jgi:hypothetical protein
VNNGNPLCFNALPSLPEGIPDPQVHPDAATDPITGAKDVLHAGVDYIKNSQTFLVCEDLHTATKVAPEVNIKYTDFQSNTRYARLFRYQKTVNSPNTGFYLRQIAFGHEINGDPGDADPKGNTIVYPKKPSGLFYQVVSKGGVLYHILTHTVT